MLIRRIVPVTFADDVLFQECVHIVAVVGDLVSRILDTLDDWATDVAALIDGWDGTAAIGLTSEIRAILERIVEDGHERRAARQPRRTLQLDVPEPVKHGAVRP